MQKAINVSGIESKKIGGLFIISAGAQKGLFEQIALGGIQKLLVAGQSGVFAFGFEQLGRLYLPFLINGHASAYGMTLS